MMIRTHEDYEKTRQSSERLQKILLELRRTDTGSQFESMSRSFLQELRQAQQEIAHFLATPDVNT